MTCSMRQNLRTSAPEGGKTHVFECALGEVRFGIWSASKPDSHGTILLLPGRTEFIEKYFEVIRDLLARNYSVLIMDWPGQGLSARPLSNRYKHHLASFDPVVASLGDLLRLDVTRELPRPLHLLAHSMGGHLSLRYLGDYDHEIKKAVFSSPMIDLLYPGMPRSLGRLLIKTMSVFGFSERYAPGNMDYGSLQRSAVGMALLTSDPERFQDEHFLIDRNPDLALGGVTYGWLQAAQRSIDLLASPGYAEGLSMPILIVQAGSDRLIDKARVALFAHRLPNGQLEFIEEARHEILKERDSIRDQFWTHFDKFMNAN